MALSKEERKANDKARYLVHKKEHNARSKAYRLAHKKERTEYDRAYYLAHRKEIADRHKVYNLTHRKEIAEYDRAKYLANAKKLIKQQREYHRKNLEKYRFYSRKRRALKRNSKHEPYTDNYIFERDGWICCICGRKVNKRLKHPNPLSKSIDHIIPISKGGADAPHNLQTSHLRCNQLKSAGAGGQLRLIG